MSTTKISLTTADNVEAPNCFKIRRRGILSGYIQIEGESPAVDIGDIQKRWQANKPVHLPGFVVNNLTSYEQEITKSKLLFETISRGGEIEDILDLPEYVERLGERFEMLATRCDDADPQEIISVDYDVMENSEMIMEDVWMRVSQLSYQDDDDSLRFRFSFGMEGYDDVSEDFERQLAAAELCENLFPESAIITKDEKLQQCLTQIVSDNTNNSTDGDDNTDVVMVERIIYFNAPNGGAQFHHDAEKGHLGVVYAQITGETFWFAMAKDALVNEMMIFLAEEENLPFLQEAIANDKEFQEFIEEAADRNRLALALDDPGHNAISILLNNVTLFFEQLINNDYGYYLKAGDIMLLPQESMQACAWHSVFCAGNEAGQALSYAVKKV